jgi:hypothetical protein
MPSSGFVQVAWSRNGVNLYCTDQTVLDWLLAELKKYISTYKVAGKRKTVSGQIVTSHIIELQGKDTEVGRWILTELCQQGWEPFEVDGVIALSDEGFAKLRRPVHN